MKNQEIQKAEVTAEEDLPASPEAIQKLEALEHQLMAEKIGLAKMEIQIKESESKREDELKLAALETQLNQIA